MTDTPIETTQTQESFRHDSFVDYLEDLRDRDDRAALAAMRRWLARSAGDQVEAMRVVQPQLVLRPKHWTRDVREEVTHLIGALFALHHREISHKNEQLGDHFRELAHKIKAPEKGKPYEPPSNVERRFMSLLACDADDFDVALRQAVMLLKSNDVPINWHLLISDAMGWKGNSAAWRDEVRKKWARRFWRKPPDDSKNNQTDESE